MFEYKKEIPKEFYAGGIIYNPKDKTFLLLFRDGNTKVEPYKWAIWGGMNEGNEKPHDTFIREFEEESGIVLKPEELSLFCEYLAYPNNTQRYTFIVEKIIDPHKIKLCEGGGFAFIPKDKLQSYELCPRSLNDINLFLKNKN